MKADDKPRVLLVDDELTENDSSLKPLKNLLDITFIDNVVDGKRHIEEGQYDLFIFDIIFGEGNNEAGLELITHSKEKKPSKPILIYSTISDNEFYMKAIQNYKANWFFPKEQHDLFKLNRIIRKLISEKKLFLSYSSKDLWFVKKLYKRLKEDKYHVFMDKDGMPGDNYMEEINRKILESNFVLAVFSDEMIESKFVKTELSVAFENDVKIVPIKFKALTKINPFQIAGTHRVDFSGMYNIISDLSSNSDLLLQKIFDPLMDFSIEFHNVRTHFEEKYIELTRAFKDRPEKNNLPALQQRQVDMESKKNKV